MPRISSTHIVTAESLGTVLAVLRFCLPGTSWSAARDLLHSHRVAVNGILCVEEARRLAVGDRVELRAHPLPPPPTDRDVTILHLDQHLVVAHKPSGMLTVRHPGDVDWSAQKKLRQPALEESLARLIADRERGPRNSRSSPVSELLVVHRIDRETSGVVMFARTQAAQSQVIRQFAAHSVHRRYLCVVPGAVTAQTLHSVQIRDRGDGLRGSAEDADAVAGRTMITHVRPLRQFAGFTELECRLETGRTNQIRIQLAELGHPLCGDVKYRGAFGAAEIPDASVAPRLALHAAELGVIHPFTHTELRWRSPWPADILRWLAMLQRSTTARGSLPAN
ncbi:MAG: RluA family pseudouridine synthase [Planctomycetota bacterium]